MWPFPKNHFEWREPREFRRARDAAEASKARWWFLPLAACVQAAIFLSGWGLSKLAGNEKAPPLEWAVLVSLAGSFVLVYILWAAFRFLPWNVMIVDGRIYRIVGSSREEWKFADLRSYTVLEWPESRVLALAPWSGREALIGIAPEVDLDALKAYFDGQGLMQLSANEAA